MEHEDRLNKIIDTLVHSTSEDVTKGAYKEWAESYESDLGGFGYVAPQTGANMFHEALKRPDGLIFDAGCGTGWVAQCLRPKGYTSIDGADFSPEMLAQAAELNIYQNLWEMNFKKPLPLADTTYDGAICIGVYSSTIGDLFLTELIRVVKPGGMIAMSCRPLYYDSDLHLQIEQHQQAGRVEMINEVLSAYMTGQNADASYVALKKQ